MPEQGPFSEYLTQSAQPRTPQPTGLENNATSIAYIGSKFLEGLRRGRMERAALAEMENAKTQKAYEQLFHFADQAKDVDPEVKRQVLAPAIQGYLGHIAGVKETSKDTGHHFTDWVKSMATNLAGGQLPKAKAPLDMAAVGNAFAALNDPNNKIQNRWLQLSQGLQQAIKGNGVMTQEAVYGLPEYQQWNAYRQTHGLEGGDEWIRSMPANTVEAAKRSTQAKVLEMVPGMISGNVPPTQSPPGQPATQQAATQAAPSGGLFDAINAHARQIQLQKQAEGIIGFPIPVAQEPTPKLETSVPIINEKGERSQGQYLPSQFKTFQPGFYNQQGQLVPGARRVTIENPDSPNKRMTPEEVAKHSAAFKQQIGSALRDPNLMRAAQSAIDANLQSNDLRGAGDVLARFMQMQQSLENSREMRAMTKALSVQNKDIRKDMAGFQVAQQFQSQEPVKKMRVIDEYTNNVNDAYSAIKGGGDPGIYDLEIMRAWAKITDPLTGVREGEYRDIAGIQGSIRDFNTKINNLLNTEGARLDDQSRETIVNAINRIYQNQYETQFKPLYESYSTAMNQAGLDTGTAIVTDPYAKKKTKTVNPPTGPEIRPDAPGRRPGASAAPPLAAKQAGSVSPALQEGAPARKRAVPKL